MEDLSLSTKAEVLFINKQMEITYKKKLTSETTLLDIIQLSADITRLEVEWADIQIKFSDIPWLDMIHIWEDSDVLRVSYHYPNPVLIYNTPSPFDKVQIGKLSEEEKNDHIVGQFYNEIWNRDKQIMSVFNSVDLFLVWGGPRNPYLSNGTPELEVDYYYDGSWWLLFSHRMIQIQKIEATTVAEIRDIAILLAGITEEIINSIVEKLS